MLREAGAAEVHMRIASPPTRHSCYYGVDPPQRAKLLAAQMNVEQTADYIQEDSLAFLSLAGLYKALGADMSEAYAPPYCEAYLTVPYPPPLTSQAPSPPTA